MNGHDIVLVERREGVLTVTLNEPEKLNPISIALQRRLREIFAAVHEDRDVRAVVITGAGRAFSAGADLTSLTPQALAGDAAAAAGGTGHTLGSAVRQAMEQLTNPVLLELRALPVPTLAAVNGPAAGGSVGLALACDIVLAARSAYFYLPFVPRLALLPDVGATWLLPRLAGLARAQGLALLDHKLGAEQAAQWGLIWACCEDAELPLRTRETARQLAALPPAAALQTRLAFEAGLARTLPEQLAHEAVCQGQLFDAPALAEGMAAFLGKRAPRFGGRDPG